MKCKVIEETERVWQAIHENDRNIMKLIERIKKLEKSSLRG